MSNFGNAFIRKSTRIPLKLKVLLTYMENEIEAVTHDISIEGMFIEPQKKLETDALLNCSLYLSEKEAPLTMLAKVKYEGTFTYTGKDSFYGAGLSITQLADDTKQILKEYLNKQFYQCKNFRRPRKTGKIAEE